MPTESPAPVVIIYEVHHHHRVPGPSVLASVELLGECHRVELSGEEVPNIEGYLTRGLPLFLGAIAASCS
jgi:hypothetical protein